MSLAPPYPVAVSRLSLAAFLVALSLAFGGLVATSMGAAALDRTRSDEPQRADDALIAARSALNTFENWRAAADANAARRAAALEQRFLEALDRAEQRSRTVAALGAIASSRALYDAWRNAAPPDARYAALRPALDAARAAQMRVNLQYLVELSMTESLSIRRLVASSSTSVALAAGVAALSALTAIALAARFLIGLISLRRPPEQRPEPQREMRMARAPTAQERAAELREKAAVRAARISAAETARRRQADLPFALRGAALNRQAGAGF